MILYRAYIGKKDGCSKKKREPCSLEIFLEPHLEKWRYADYDWFILCISLFEVKIKIIETDLKWNKQIDVRI